MPPLRPLKTSPTITMQHILNARDYVLNDVARYQGPLDALFIDNKKI